MADILPDRPNRHDLPVYKQIDFWQCYGTFGGEELKVKLDMTEKDKPDEAPMPEKSSRVILWKLMVGFMDSVCQENGLPKPPTMPMSLMAAVIMNTLVVEITYHPLSFDSLDEPTTFSLSRSAIQIEELFESLDESVKATKVALVKKVTWKLPEPFDRLLALLVSRIKNGLHDIRQEVDWEEYKRLSHADLASRLER